jgi:hypothetical protein
MVLYNPRRYLHSQSGPQSPLPGNDNDIASGSFLISPLGFIQQYLLMTFCTLDLLKLFFQESIVKKYVLARYFYTSTTLPWLDPRHLMPAG